MNFFLRFSETGMNIMQKNKEKKTKTGLTDNNLLIPIGFLLTWHVPSAPGPPG